MNLDAVYELREQGRCLGAACGIVEACRQLLDLLPVLFRQLRVEGDDAGIWQVRTLGFEGRELCLEFSQVLGEGLARAVAIGDRRDDATDLRFMVGNGAVEPLARALGPALIFLPRTPHIGHIVGDRFGPQHFRLQCFQDARLDKMQGRRAPVGASAGFAIGAAADTGLGDDDRRAAAAAAFEKAGKEMARPAALVDRSIAHLPLEGMHPIP